MAERRVCAGFRTSGHWKGWPCGAQATVVRYGANWCKNHLPLDEEAAAEAISDRERVEAGWEPQHERGRWRSSRAGGGEKPC